MQIVADHLREQKIYRNQIVSITVFEGHCHTQDLHAQRIKPSPFTKEFRVLLWGAPIET